MNGSVPDLRHLEMLAAPASGQETAIGAQAARRFREFTDNGHGDLDFSAIYRVIR